MMDGFSRWLLPAVPPRPDRVPYIRQQVATVLQLWSLDRVDDLAWSAQLLVDELTANVIRHARTLFNLSLTWDGRRLRGEVTDADPTVPRPDIHPDDDAVGGRGLMLVSEVADRWGFDRYPQGKTVWFEITAA